MPRLWSFVSYIKFCFKSLLSAINIRYNEKEKKIEEIYIELNCELLENNNYVPPVTMSRSNFKMDYYFELIQ